MIMMMMKELPVMAAGFLSWKRLGKRNWVNIYFQSLMFFWGGILCEFGHCCSFVFILYFV